MKKIPVLVYTDIGDDIDDSLAIVYLLWCADIDVVGIVCVHKNISYRVHTAKNLTDVLDSKVPILGEDHTDFIQDILKKYNQDLVILSLAPTTQLYKDMQLFPSLFATIKRIYFQWQIEIHEGKTSPDMQSYNFKQDPEAIQWIFSLNIPMTFVGKYAAYAIPLVSKDFQFFIKKNPKVWKHLYQEAQLWKMRLAKLSPDMYQKLYEKNPDIMSYPYDLLTAVAITHDNMFIKETIGRIECIGQKKWVAWIQDISRLKTYILEVL